MDSVKLNQIVDKVNQLLNGADDCFDETAGYVIFTDKYASHKTIKIWTSHDDESSRIFEINVYDRGGIEVTEAFGLNEDQVIELLNKTSL